MRCLTYYSAGSIFRLKLPGIATYFKLFVLNHKRPRREQQEIGVNALFPVRLNVYSHTIPEQLTPDRALVGMRLFLTNRAK